MSFSLLLLCGDSSGTAAALPFPPPDGPLDRERPLGMPETSPLTKEKHSLGNRYGSHKAELKRILKKVYIFSSMVIK